MDVPAVLECGQESLPWVFQFDLYFQPHFVILVGIGLPWYSSFVVVVGIISGRNVSFLGYSSFFFFIMLEHC